MAKIQCKAQVVSVEKLQEGIFSMWLEVPEIAAQAAAGQLSLCIVKRRITFAKAHSALCED